MWKMLNKAFDLFDFFFFNKIFMDGILNTENILCSFQFKYIFLLLTVDSKQSFRTKTKM